MVRALATNCKHYFHCALKRYNIQKVVSQFVAQKLYEIGCCKFKFEFYRNHNQVTINNFQSNGNKPYRDTDQFHCSLFSSYCRCLISLFKFELPKGTFNSRQGTLRFGFEWGICSPNTVTSLC